MSKTAFLFPGQGSQVIGMGVSLATQHPDLKAYYQKASDILEWNLWTLCENGPEDRLRQTDMTQPALYVTGYAAFKALQKEGLSPQAVAGHSIGEYVALAAAGVFSFEDGLKLVQRRGQLMKEVGQKNPGTMAAVLGLSGSIVEKICQDIQASGICVAVNFNSPEQTVIAGTEQAIGCFY